MFSVTMRKHLVRSASPLLAAALTACVSSGAPISGNQALSPEEMRLQTLETKVADLTRRMNGMEASRTSGNVADDVRSLRGTVEELQHNTQQSDQQMQAQLQALQQRVQQLETGGVPPPGSAAADGSAPAGGAAPAASGSVPVPGSVAPGAGAVPTPPTQATPPAAAAAAAAAPAAAASTAAQEQAVYLANFNLLKAGKYDDAIRGFRSELDQYPQGSFSDNAWYWMGESYYVKRDYNKALDSFQSLLSRFPASPKVPDATLKVGVVQLDMKKTADGKATLQKVVSSFPNSNAAAIARSKLDQLH